MKRNTTLVAVMATAAVLGLASCSKTCKCTRYNMAVDSYSEEEVDRLGGSCSDLKYRYSDASDAEPYRYYTVCEWEND